MDSLELKVPEKELEDHLRKVRYMSRPDRRRKAKENKAPKQQQQISATEGELKALKSRNKKWSEDQDQRVGAGNKGSKYTSNKTHYSPTDPDARISVKPGKARKLNYSAQLTVDSAHHVITDMMADYADKKDNQSLQQVSVRVKQRLHQHGLLWHNVLADTGYSSGDNYAYLEREGLQSFIPPHGTYKGCPDLMTYDREGDYYVCRNGKHLTHRKVKYSVKGTKENHYATGRKDCRGCQYAQACKGNSHEKRIRVTFYKPEYERAIARIRSKQGRYMKKKRQSTVEPVFGTLTQFMGLRKVNTKGIRQAQKVMLLSAVAYNVKKYLKFTQKLAQSGVGTARTILNNLIAPFQLLLLGYKPVKI
jgi:radical SAM protein with 4Fe4S-binding SPASM domain